MWKRYVLSIIVKQCIRWLWVKYLISCQRIVYFRQFTQFTQFTATKQTPVYRMSSDWTRIYCKRWWNMEICWMGWNKSKRSRGWKTKVREYAAYSFWNTILFTNEKNINFVIVTESAISCRATLTFGLPSGSRFERGIHAIQYSATDKHGLKGFCSLHFRVIGKISFT